MSLMLHSDVISHFLLAKLLSSDSGFGSAFLHEWNGGLKRKQTFHNPNEIEKGQL